MIDSSAWLEYFAAGPQARHVAAAIENLERLLFPTIVLIEVAHRVMQQRDEDAALRCDAITWTLKADFKDLPGVKYFSKSK